MGFCLLPNSTPIQEWLIVVVGATRRAGSGAGGVHGILCPLVRGASRERRRRRIMIFAMRSTASADVALLLNP